jgi:TRAP-type C4-dicarboxylate transport system substrate-binding protein
MKTKFRIRGRPRTVIMTIGLASVMLGCQAAPAADRAGGAPAPTTLTLITGENDQSEVQPFVNAVRRLTDGSLTIDVKTGWRPGEATYESGLIHDVIDGKADLGVTGVRAFDAEDIGVTAFQGFLAPFLITTYELQEHVLDGAAAEATLAALDPLGLAGIGFDPGPLRRPLGISRRLASVADFEGASFGAREGGVTAATLNALGGTATIFAPDQASGLDGMEAHLFLIAHASYDTGAHSLASDIVLWPRLSVLFANSAAFDRLSPEHQAALHQAAIDVRADRLTEIGSEEGEGRTTLCRRGIALTAVGASAFEELSQAVAPVYDAIARDPLAAAVMEEARRLGAGTSGPAEAIACAEAPASPTSSNSTSPSPLEGEWEACVTWDELRAAGADAGENNPGNIGCHVLHFEGDRFYSYRPGSEPGTIGATFDADGTFELGQTDQSITFNLENGERFEYTWSLFEDTLSFRRVSFGPTALVVKPFTDSDD